jgi:hypothetical protein
MGIYSSACRKTSSTSISIQGIFAIGILLLGSASAQAVIPQTYSAPLSVIAPYTQNLTGSGTFSTTINGNSATFVMTLQNITDVTMAHIHQLNSTLPLIGLIPDAPGPGPITVSAFNVTTARQFGGSYNASSIFTQAAPAGYTWTNLLTDIASGNAFVNVHTVQVPGGLLQGTLKLDKSSDSQKVVASLMLCLLVALLG